MNEKIKHLLVFPKNINIGKSHSTRLVKKNKKIKTSTDQVVSHTNTHQEGLPAVEGAIHYTQHRRGRGRET